MGKCAVTWVLLMVLSCPLMAFISTGAQDDGTPFDGLGGCRAVTMIYSIYDLQNMSLDLNGDYALANAINA